MQSKSRLRVRKQASINSSINNKNSNNKTHTKKRILYATGHDAQKEENTGHSPFIQSICGDARRLPLAPNSIDLVITSPAYWRKRDYQHPNQIGQERTAQQYVAALVEVLGECRRVLKATGSVFLNIGDTYRNRSLSDIPSKVEAAARTDNWIVRNRIIWVKETGMPEPAQNRLANRHEYILHLVVSNNYYYDLFAYAQRFGNGANPGDVWNINPGRNLGDHLAPFPDELVERAVVLACPSEVCILCGKPRTRIVRRTANLDASRPQARRAMEIAQEAGLSMEHIAAIQATGISDAGKALRFQTGTNRSSARVQELAQEAKAILGGYFREFTFAQRETIGWTSCSCGARFKPGLVLDQFMGTGTTLKVAARLGRSAIGVDLNPLNIL